MSRSKRNIICVCLWWFLVMKDQDHTKSLSYYRNALANLCLRVDFISTLGLMSHSPPLPISALGQILNLLRLFLQFSLDALHFVHERLAVGLECNQLLIRSSRSITENGKFGVEVGFLQWGSNGESKSGILYRWWEGLPLSQTASSNSRSDP